MAALATGWGSSTALLALGNESKAISEKEKADRERDERAQMKEADYKQGTNCKEARYTQSKISFAWTVEDNEAITSMIPGGSTYTEIALAMGKGLKWSDIQSRWTRHLKH